MAYKDLREFIEDLESKGLLKRIKTEVDPELEITEITDRVSKMKGEKNVALLFENVKGSKMPVLMNAFGSYERMAMALGVEKLDDVADELREMMKLPYVSLQNKMSVVTMIPMIKRAINFPKYVKHAPCQEVVETENPNLDEIPILKCWPDDGGPFVTLPLVCRQQKTRKPERQRRLANTLYAAKQPGIMQCSVFPRIQENLLFLGMAEQIGICPRLNRAVLPFFRFHQPKPNLSVTILTTSRCNASILLSASTTIQRSGSFAAISRKPRRIRS